MINTDNGSNLDYAKHLVEQAPTSAYYIPNFITEDEEKELLKNVYNAPKPKWTQLSNRRLQNWGGLPHPKGMVAEEIPKWLNVHFQRLNEFNFFDGKSPNHALVNEYLPCQGIMPHVDGPLFYPTITTISLGSHTVLDFYSPLNDDGENDEVGNKVLDVSWKSRYIGSFLLEPRSLVCFKQKMYHNFLHGIEELQSDDVSKKKIFNQSYLGDMILDSCVTSRKNPEITRKTRVSVTIRHFPKTLKVALNLGRR